MRDPFLVETDKPLVAIVGSRCGYLQIAPAKNITHYSEFPDTILLAAKNWAGTLQTLGAKRVYWITLSEAVTHLHIHLYPRWRDDEDKGVTLFGQRNNNSQPVWTTEVGDALTTWASQHGAHVIN